MFEDDFLSLGFWYPRIASNCPFILAHIILHARDNAQAVHTCLDVIKVFLLYELNTD